MIRLIAATAVGYVLGARAGRERYEQIVRYAARVWHDELAAAAANDRMPRRATSGLRTRSGRRRQEPLRDELGRFVSASNDT